MLALLKLAGGKLNQYHIVYVLLILVLLVVCVSFMVQFFSNGAGLSANIDTQPYQQVIDALQNVSHAPNQLNTSPTSDEYFAAEVSEVKLQLNFKILNQISDKLTFVFRAPTTQIEQDHCLLDHEEPVTHAVQPDDTNKVMIKNLLQRVHSLELQQQTQEQMPVASNAGYISKLLLVKSIDGMLSALVRLKLDIAGKQTDYWVSKGDWIGNCLVSDIDQSLDSLHCRPYNHQIIQSNHEKSNTIQLVLDDWRQW